MIWRILSWAVVLAVPALWLSRFFISGQGMGVFSGLMVYLVAWWIVLFAILPIGVRGQFEDGDVTAGSEPGAPSTPDLKRKAWWTTIAASVVWLVLFAVLESGVFTQDTFAFMPG